MSNKGSNALTTQTYTKGASLSPYANSPLWCASQSSMLTFLTSEVDLTSLAADSRLGKPFRMLITGLQRGKNWLSTRRRLCNDCRLKRTIPRFPKLYQTRMLRRDQDFPQLLNFDRI
ncbi:hypothetical protein PoB_006869400 [Plakobranchus ocellatus]|uniref:Uncharacterized protein n=1 Tax=Plakobranchus ocellatus TaxID=259542 RepID=A0AAV4DDD2_9GAST|nr:hypothetical protein PoB_006869400 [Plakobranchus ocellatus]